MAKKKEILKKEIEQIPLKTENYPPPPVITNHFSHRSASMLFTLQVKRKGLRLKKRNNSLQYKLLNT